MAEVIDCDVLVVGAGPTGVTLGLLLARGGLTTFVVDKAPDIYPLPRAAHIDHEIMRLLQELGVAAQVAATCRTASRYDFLTARGEILLRFEGIDRVGPGGWPASNMIHQPSLEAILRTAADKQPQFQLRTSWNWKSYRSDAGAVVSTIAVPDGEREVRSKYLVGADGARSPVRTAAEIEMEDLGFDEEWLVIDALVHDAERLPEVNLQICDPDRPTTCVLMGSGRHRWEFMLKPHETADDLLPDDVIARLLKPWNVDGAITLERKAVYRFNAKVAKHWRKGRILLAGDAAHLTPPFAGQGLCSGMRDAANLAWKLIAVSRNADDSILDTYQTEREAHVRPIISLAMMMGRTVCIADPAAARARDEQMLAARAAGSAPDGAVSNPPLGPGIMMLGCSEAGSYFPQVVAADGTRLDDILGSGAWLIGRGAGGTPRRTALKSIDLAEPRLAPFGSQLDTWLAKHNADAVLVRPDRYVFGTGAPESLMRAWLDLAL
ncbi:MAG: bifunctional 3-(3-hydroxy-phenyl)propionate/3-hydroxycinnamic acid hydroxylase [Alphaproteobacteria bacterium]|nr:bifunctional 3-(3-hydroxy-phenyl)propionate/3-hydroxycinnamic acid hydroxylase [Alphaproteobacteria bacterium]MBL7099728.1 bifunctional 3-(3-hydroxy-phenyl)propionate/3-hydroxycinnamic acid hydroxylase [Alphaproteobacteria bacterium]